MGGYGLRFLLLLLVVFLLYCGLGVAYRQEMGTGMGTGCALDVHCTHAACSTLLTTLSLLLLLLV